MTKKDTHAPDANHEKGLAKTAEKGQTKTMFRQLPTAQKSCKKQYEIKIFVVRDQNMTKKTTTRQMLITIKDLQNQLKKVKKNNVSTAAPGSKMFVKNNTESRVSF